MYHSRRETAEMLGVSPWTLARAASDPVFGPRMEASGILPPVDHEADGKTYYLIDEIKRALATRAEPANAIRLRAKRIK